MAFFFWKKILSQGVKHMKYLAFSMLVFSNGVFAIEHQTTPRTVTYYQDVAPILNRQCQSCHQSGALASFLPLDTYEQVKPMAKLIRAVTQSKKMPPFMPDNSGSCTTYENARVLSDSELKTLAAWADQGAPEGAWADPLPPPESASELQGQTHQTAMPEPYTPDATMHDDYRCFLINPGITGEKSLYLTDYLVVPGDKKLVHHVIAYQASTEAGAADARAKDAAEPGPGYTCFGATGIAGARTLMNWTPGTNVISMPRDTGVRIDPQFPLIVQVHYHIMEKNPGTDQTTFKMKLVDSVPHEMTATLLRAKELSIPPQLSEYVHEKQLNLVEALGADKPIRLMGVRAHMHKMGRKMNVSVQTADKNRCVVDVPRYDFNWQSSYFLNEPIDMMSQDLFNIRCVYNSMDKKVPTLWGEGTDDEMCIATVYTIPR
jgi:hypothetical protein